jgi:DNA end-binding protein Ku
MATQRSKAGQSGANKSAAGRSGRKAGRKAAAPRKGRAPRAAVHDGATGNGAAGNGDGAEPVRSGPRPIWSGTISFGLVSVPVNLYPAVRPAGASVRLMTDDGAPLQRRFVCPADDVDTPWEELVRGYEVGDERYVELTDEELEAVEPRKSRDIDLRLFVPLAELDPFLFERAYVLTPGGETTKPYRLIAEIMEREQKAGIATFVMRTKEYLVAILAHKGILWAETLRFAGELRTPKDIGLPARAAPGKQSVAAFERAIGPLERPGIEREELRDERQQRLQRLVERKRRRGVDVVESAPAADGAADGAAAADGAEAPDLFDAIRRSLHAVAGRGRQVSGGAARRRAAPRSTAGAPSRSRPRRRRRSAAAAARSAR